MKATYFILFLIIVLACNKTDPYASLSRQLTLNDFQAKPFVRARGLILTEVRYKIESIDSTTHLPDVKCTIIPENFMHHKRSFIMRNGFNSKEVLLALKHEQCHYDITSLYAIELKKITEQTLFKTKDLKSKIDSLLRLLRPKYDSIHRRFDMDATYADQQISKWSVRLKKQLNEQLAEMKKENRQ